MPFPDAVIGFIGGELTADFERALPSLDWRCSWDDPSAGSGLRLQQILAEQRRCHGPVQLALNLDGSLLTCSLVPSLEPVYVAGGTLSANRRRDLSWGSIRVSASWGSDWDSPAFQRYADVFSSNYIAELFCQLAWVHDYVDPTAIELPSATPPFAVPDLLILHNGTGNQGLAVRPGGGAGCG